MSKAKHTRVNNPPPQNLRFCGEQPGPIFRGTEGIALVAALVILLALTIMGFMMLNRASLVARGAGVDREQAQALYLAEAGIALVRYWFKEAEEHARTSTADLPFSLTGTYGSEGANALIPYIDEVSDGDGSSGTYSTLRWGFFKRRFIVDAKPDYIQNAYSQFADPDGDGWSQGEDSYNPVDTAPPGGASAFEKKYGRPALYISDPDTLTALMNALDPGLSQAGTIKFIGIYPPIGTEQSPGTSPPRAFATVRVEVETASGYTRTIEQELVEPPFLPVAGAAEAGATAGWSGAGRFRWGPIMALGNVTVGGSGNNVPTGCADTDGDGIDDLNDCTDEQGTSNKCYDKWFSARSSGEVDLSADANDCTDCIGCSGEDDVPPAGKRPYKNHKVYENTTVELDFWDHSEVKEYASGIGAVYTYDGKYFYRGETVAGTPIDPKVFFDPDGDYLGAQGLVYIKMASGVDTMDIDLGQTYSGPITGTIFVEGSVNMDGSGGGWDITVKNPDQYDGLAAGETSLTDVHIHGVVYATGDITSTGNPKVFGAILAEGLIDVSGNTEVWYDRSLIDGHLGPKQPNTIKAKWREVK